MARTSTPLEGANTSPSVETCRQNLERFFRHYPDQVMQESAMKALRFLASGGKPLAGKPEGWAAGILYYLANRYKRPCGVAGILNAEFEQFFGVSMDTVRKRAAHVMRAITI